MRQLLDNLSMRAKMGLIAAMTLVMTLVPTALMSIHLLSAFGDAQSELRGLDPAARLLQAMRATQQHRGLSNGALSGNAAAATEREGVSRALKEQLPPLVAAAATLGDEALVRRIAEHRSQLEALLEAVAQRSLKAPESFARHTQLVDQQAALLYDLSVAARLVLHPEASGYFLQDAALNRMPATVEAMARLRGQGMGVLSRKEITPSERAQLAATVAQLRAQGSDVQRALDLALHANPALKQALAAPMATAAKSMTEGLGYVEDRLVKAESIDEPPAQWWARTTQAIDAQYALGDAVRTALSGEMQGYADGLRNEVVAVGVLLLLGLVVGALVLRAVSVRVVGAMGQAVEVAEAVAQGDLTRRVQASGRDECARMLRALDGMASGLAATVGGVRDNASQVATASTQIAQGNMDLSGRTEQQASALQQTAASIEQLSTTVTQTAEHAREARQMAETARDVATRGGAAVGDMVATMKEIDSSSRRIGEIIGTIDGIAFQTNILALNAAVEAARAGEQGRGFAVVAGEVRTLAQRSAEAAREIRGLIGASVERAELGSAQADRAGTTMNEIVAAIDRVTQIMQAIATAASEQSAGVEQVGQAMGEIDRATQQNAALVEESAAAADSLRRQADGLIEAMAAFRVAAHGVG